MKTFSKSVKKIVFALVAVFLVAQVVRIDKSNPPLHSDLTAVPGVKDVVRRACYNCHSNETVWPWYSNLAPASWLIANDVKEARSHLNFSEWGTYDNGKQSHKLRGIAEELQADEMPPWYYSMAHSDSRLSPAESDKIIAWTSEMLERETK